MFRWYSSDCVSPNGNADILHGGTSLSVYFVDHVFVWSFVPGNIPPELGQLAALVILHLNGNQLSGESLGQCGGTRARGGLVVFHGQETCVVSYRSDVFVAPIQQTMLLSDSAAEGPTGLEIFCHYPRESK